MRLLKRTLLLIVMMFGHNYVINQAQALQSQYQEIHQASVTKFNTLYSIPSGVAILVILPLGALYERKPNGVMMGGAIALLLGQIVVCVFSTVSAFYGFPASVIGRTVENVGAEILYMVQGSLACTWLPKVAGLIFILPEVGEVLNVLLTPQLANTYGMQFSLFMGAIACLMSFIAVWLLYLDIKMQESLKKLAHQQIERTSTDIKQEAASQNDMSHQIGVSQNISTEPCSKFSIYDAGKVFWMTVAVCAFNECLYFPFLDNANELIRQRFCISYEDTGYFLSIPFISAICTTIILKVVMEYVPRRNLVFYVSFVPVLGHFAIYANGNCTGEAEWMEQIMLVVGLTLFGMGVGSYYAVTFPAVGLSLPEDSRGSGYAFLAFMQTIALTIIPLVSGMIVESQKIRQIGYSESSLLFIFLATAALICSYMVFRWADDNTFSEQHPDSVAFSPES